METTEMEQSMQWFVFFKDQLLLKKEYTTNGENKYGIPYGVTPPVTPAAGCKIHEVTLTGGKKVKACALGQPVPETEEWVMTGLRASYDYLPLADYQAAGKAFQILYWDSHSRFCPVCGTPMEQKEDIMKRCPKCGREVYPSISTAILVLVRKEDSLLLVHARNFKGSGLMVGFIADYAGGEIRLQEEELSSGDFYTRDNLPELPRKLSLARKMIDWWLECSHK